MSDDQDLHHFVSQCYLRAFVDPELVKKSKHQVWVYRRGHKPVPLGVRRIAALDRYYELAQAGRERKAENAFSTIEAVAAPILKRLRSGEATTTQDEKADFAVFLAMSMARVPFSRKLIDVTEMEAFRARTIDVIENAGALEVTKAHLEAQGITMDEFMRYAVRVIRGELRPPSPSQEQNVSRIFETIDGWRGYFAGMAWGICMAPEGSTYITSDNPVVVHDVRAMKKGPEAYEGPTTDLRFFMPLAPGSGLSGEFVKTYDQRMNADGAWVKQCNVAQIYHAHQEVYASFYSGELRDQVDDIFGKRRKRLVETYFS
jgi:hypothetical protein